MTNWSSLALIAKEAFFSDPLGVRADKLNKRIEELLARREAFDRRRDEMLARDAADLEPTQLASELLCGEGNAVERLELLGIELHIRRDLAEFFEARQSDAQAAAHTANQAHEEMRVKVCEALVEIGYEPWTGSVERPFSIVPIFWMRHPNWQRTRAEAESASAKSRDRSLAEANERATGEIEQQIAAIRQRAATA
jgi:hypothetical protein